MVKLKKLTRPVGATAIAFAIASATVIPASAADNIQKFGVREKLDDYWSGAPYIGYTVRDLIPSSDPVAHNGQLYEATMTVDAMNGWQTPLIPLFNARAESSQLYRVIANAPGGISGAPVPPGGSSTGKLYFDVVGDAPNSVVYNDGTRDILAWVS